MQLLGKLFVMLIVGVVIFCITAIILTYFSVPEFTKGVYSGVIATFAIRLVDESISDK